MQIDTRQAGERVVVVAPRGRLVIGESVEELEERVVDLVDGGSHFLVIDLSQVARIDSSGVGSLVSALRNCRDSGGDACLAGPSEHLRKVLEMMGLLQVFEIHPTVEDAVRALDGR